MNHRHLLNVLPAIITIAATMLTPSALAGTKGPQNGHVLVVPAGGGGARIESFITTRNEEPRVNTQAVVKWDDKALTVVFHCQDGTIAAEQREHDDANIWRDDSVEVFLDPGHTHDDAGSWIHIIVSASGATWDECGPVVSRFSTGDPMGGISSYQVRDFHAEVKRVDDGWTAEVRLTWDDIGARPGVGDVWGFNLARTEHPSEEYTCFSPTWGPFLSIDQWGHLVFADQAGDVTGAAMDSIERKHADITRERDIVKGSLMWHAGIPDLGQTWTEIDGRVYGAKPDDRGPIGGGEGYTRVVTKGDLHVTTLDELLDALSKAQTGQTVFIDGGVTIDCTVMTHVEKLAIEIPAGVTLASDRGHEGSQGAMILSDTFATSPLIRCLGPDVRITGIRLRGPDPQPRFDLHNRASQRGRTKGVEGGFDHEYYYKFPNSEGIHTEHDRLEVDNCEIAGWSHAGVYLRAGEGHHVHHNFIHHCQRNGLGYGVCHDKAQSLIDYNLFNYNRHSIAATGAPHSGYEACHNVEILHSLSHCFDMHGGGDRKDGTNIAGTWMKVHHNTFRSPEKPIRIRGTPEQEAVVHNNWFHHHRSDTKDGRMRPVDAVERTRVYDNAYGLSDPAVLDPQP